MTDISYRSRQIENLNPRRRMDRKSDPKKITPLQEKVCQNILIDLKEERVD